VGGNGTWYGLADHSGDATDNTVNIKQGSTIKGTFNGFNASAQEHYVAIGGRATGTSASKGNSVNISGGNIASASTASKNYIAGGFGQKVSSFYGEKGGVRVKNYGLPKEFFNRYNPDDLAHEYHLTAPRIAADVLREMR